MNAALKVPIHDDLKGSSHSAIPLPNPANRCLVELDGSFKWLPKFLDLCTTGAVQTIESLDRGIAGRRIKSMTAHGDSQHKKHQQSALRCVCEPNRIPCRCPRVTSSGRLPLESPIGNAIRTRVSTTQGTLVAPKSKERRIDFGENSFLNR